MPHHPYIQGARNGYDKTRDLRAERRNEKHSGHWGNSLKALEKLKSMNLESLIHGMAAHLPKNMSKRDKTILLGIAALLAIASIGAAYALYNSRSNYPQIKSAEYRDAVKAGESQNFRT